MAEYDKSLFEEDPKIYEYRPGFWGFEDAFPRAAIDAARVAEFRDSDILTATFPKTGKNQT